MSAVARMQQKARAGADTAQALLAWYDKERRDLPWRYGPGLQADPYHVWLSEIMLQQTTVKVVVPYFQNFLKRWPGVMELAAASEDSVLEAWAGLGYYSRARNLHACAVVVANEFNGQFPVQEAELRKLPGIGPYTAAAIAAIAFGERTTPIDGNIERVVSRLFAVENPLPKSKPRLKELACGLTPSRRAGDFAQAMMDLGATVCTPKRPSCLICPLHKQCAAHALGIAARLPAKQPKPERPVRYGTAFVALSETGQVLVRRRPETGLLARMLEVPSTAWLDCPPSAGEALRVAPVQCDWWHVPGTVVHTFTHFRLEVDVYRAIVPDDTALTFWADAGRCQWVPRRDLRQKALPSAMRKIITHGLTEL